MKHRDIEILIRFDQRSYIAQCVQFDVCGTGDTPMEAFQSCLYLLRAENTLKDDQGTGLSRIDETPEVAVRHIRDMPNNPPAS